MSIFMVLHLLTAMLIAGKMMGFGDYTWLQSFYPSIAAIPLAIITAILLHITRD